MEIIFARQSATVNDICGMLDGQPTPMAVRRMLAILQEKGHLKRNKQGREFVYSAKKTKSRAGVQALRQVVETFFDGSIANALATHLEKPGTRVSDEDVETLSRLVDELRRDETDGK